MTRAKLVLIMCKALELFCRFSRQEETKGTIIVENILGGMSEYIAAPSENGRVFLKRALDSFLKKFEEESEEKLK